MKKRITLLLAAALLTLSACGTAAAGQTTEPAKSTVTPVTESTQAPAAQANEPTATPAEIPEATPEPEVYYSKADCYSDSALAAGNGAVYPYTDGAQYGMFGADGKLYTGLIYSGVEMLKYNNGFTAGAEPVGIWRMQQGESISDESGFLQISSNVCYGAAAADGSFATECVYHDVFAVDRDAVVCVRVLADGDSTAWDVYRNDGTLLFSGTDEPFASQAYPGTPYTLQRSGDGWIAELLDGWYYLDASLKLQAGAFEYLTVFDGGHCLLQTGGTTMIADTGFANVLGNTGELQVGMIGRGYITLTDGENIRVVDSNLNTVLYVQGDAVLPEDYGFCVIRYGEEDMISTFYDLQGKEMSAYNDGKHNNLDGQGIIWTAEADSVSVCAAATGKTAVLNGAQTLLPFYVDGYVIHEKLFEAAQWNDDFTAGSAMLLNDALEAVASGFNIYYRAVPDAVTGEVYIAETAQDESSATLLKLQGAGNPCIRMGEYQGELGIMNGLITVLDGTCFTVRSSDGTLLLRYPAGA